MTTICDEACDSLLAATVEPASEVCYTKLDLRLITEGIRMDEEAPESYFLLCSTCHTPCSGADAHVIPRWDPERRKIFTTYRCSNCWLQPLEELRAAVATGECKVLASFCDFLRRQGYRKDADTIRAASSGQQKAYLLAIVDAVQAQKIKFHP